MANEVPTFKHIHRLNNRIDIGEIGNGAVVKLEGLLVSVSKDRSFIILTDVRGDGVWADVSPSHPITRAGDNEVSVQGEYYRAPSNQDHDRIVLYSGNI